MPERIGYTRAFTRQEEINSVIPGGIPEPVPAQSLTPDLADWGCQIFEATGRTFLWWIPDQGKRTLRNRNPRLINQKVPSYIRSHLTE